MQQAVEKILQLIRELQQQKPQLLIAIDGRSNAGKTTLAHQLQKHLDCNIIHVDHFFRHAAEFQADIKQNPGANIDFERLQQEVILPLSRGEDCAYRVFDCALQQFGESILLPRKAVNIVEGAYSCHPQLFDCYDLRIFLDISPQEQKQRLLQREGEERAEIFFAKWIPLEEAYFAECEIAVHCDYCFSL